MLSPEYPIETERLLLRPYTIADHDDALSYNSIPELHRYLYWEAFTQETFGARLETLVGRTELKQADDVITLAVVPRELGRAVGDVTLIWRSEEHRQAEIGFIFHPDHQGKGYATEASRVLLELAFDGLGAHRVYGRLDPRNTASAAVLKRLGMRLEAHLVENEFVKGEWTSEAIYALLEREWRAASGSDKNFTSSS